MGAIKTAADNVYRDDEMLGVPASGPHRPIRSEIRGLFSSIDNLFGNTVDVVWVTGQSNANNSSESLATSPVIPIYTVGDPRLIALKYQSGALSPCNDPVGPGTITLGSAWPSFALTYWQATGRKVCIIPTGVGSSAMQATADLGTGNWSSTGILYATAHAAFSAALTALTAAGYQIGKIFVIDVQGETDAVGIDSSTSGVSAAGFKTAKQAMFALMRGDLGITSLPIYFSMLGVPQTGSTAGYAAIRAKQAEIIAADPYTKAAFWGADTFAGRGLMQAGPDALHYTQAGYNELGRIAARNIVSGSFSQGIEPFGAGPYTNDSFSRYRGLLLADDVDLSFVSDRAFATAGRMYYNSTSGISINAKAGSAEDFTIFNPGGQGIAYNPTGTFNFAFTGGLQFPTNRAFSALNSIYKDAASGLSLVAKTGSVQDFTLYDPSGLGIFYVPTGTRNVIFAASIAGNMDAGNLTSGTVPIARLNLSQITNALGGDVNLNNTANFFDGPSIAQGSTGTWFASGSITLKDTVGTGSVFFCKLWDGTTIIASGSVTIPNATQLATLSLSGYIASPAGNIRMSAKDVSATTGVIVASSAGTNSSIVSALRIA